MMLRLAALRPPDDVAGPAAGCRAAIDDDAPAWAGDTDPGRGSESGIGVGGKGRPACRSSTGSAPSPYAIRAIGRLEDPSVVPRLLSFLNGSPACTAGGGRGHRAVAEGIRSAEGSGAPASRCRPASDDRVGPGLAPRCQPGRRIDWPDRLRQSCGRRGHRSDAHRHRQSVGERQVAGFSARVRPAKPRMALQAERKDREPQPRHDCCAGWRGGWHAHE